MSMHAISRILKEKTGILLSVMLSVGSLVPFIWFYLAPLQPEKHVQSNSLTLVSFTFLPVLFFPLSCFYYLVIRSNCSDDEKMAALSLWLMAFFGASCDFFALWNSPSLTSGHVFLSSEFINNFSRCFILSSIAVILYRNYHQQNLENSKFWMMPLLLLFGLSTLQVFDLQKHSLHRELQGLVGVCTLLSIFNAIIFARIGLRKDSPTNVILAWTSFLQVMSQIAYLRMSPGSDIGQLIFLQNLVDGLSLLLPLPLLSQNLLASLKNGQLDKEELDLTEDVDKIRLEQAFNEGSHKARQVLMHRISMEFKSPLNTIIGYSEMLMEELGEKASRSAQNEVQKINRSGWYLLSLLDELLDANSLAQQNFRLKETQFEAEKFMQILRKIAIRLAGPQHVEIKTYYQDNLEPIFADEARLLQLCTNVIKNSLRYLKEGSISIHLYGFIKDDTRYFSIDIRDNGSGIEKQELLKILSNQDPLTLDADAGSGGLSLGLPASRKLCELMGGHLSIETALHKGSTFSLTFPHRTQVQAKAINRLADALPDQAILLIDDDVEYTEYMRELFETAGLPTIAVNKGRSALRIYLERKPRVVVVDLKMPDIDGISVIQTIREQDPNCHIIAVSGEGLDHTEDAAKAAGSNQFFAKPMAIESLIQSIEDRQSKGF